MKITSRYENKYNAFIDALYIVELCDTNDFAEFVEMFQTYGYNCSFNGYVNDTKLDNDFLVFLNYIDINNKDELTRAEELIDAIAL